MSDNFDRAVEYCYNYLHSLFDKGITRKDIGSMSRSEMLGVFDDDFDWHTALATSNTDYDAYDSLKRHCAHLITKKIYSIRCRQITQWVCSDMAHSQHVAD